MEVISKLRFYRQSPRKVRLVADSIRGLNPEQALDALMFINKRAAHVLSKLVKSAVSDAQNNFSLSKNNLLIKSISVDSGPTLKRSRARAFGRAAPIRKHTSHICIVLEEKIKQTAKKEGQKNEKDSFKNTGDIKSVKTIEEMKIVKDIKEGETFGLTAPLSKSGKTPKKGFAPKLIQRKSG